ncbi:catechol 2,3-dioxygenase-like lactoylglutathione lyase family enzyme [Allocatelliglobosispora scoriae]|uniref:Catechol 2,3-dioxygenase-like lactoylglutathione lyase family enzyme n=1 Tax=Allocatelliglobosispora scoriae TaxID=643052 RepID=A0A841BS37_9ACTN|nr:VOC family protein [Allocatelliglobosispora scoriae]MBB5869723.1 catechol 2,3-dioxygenase-like lactoylglutathione lyase family enzyme [Allocatelliglobosispora scoriae]
MTVTGRVLGTLPASDLARAKDFYARNLGLKPVKETDAGLVFECGDNSRILLFPSTGRASGDHTQAVFEVADVSGEVATMKANGITFEEFDLPGMRTEDGVVTMEGVESAFFHDSEGNLICISQHVDV